MSLILIAESAHAVSYRSPHLGNAGEGAAGSIATDRPPGWARHEPRSLSINVVRLRRFRDRDRPARRRLHPAAHDRGGYHALSPRGTGRPAGRGTRRASRPALTRRAW